MRRRLVMSKRAALNATMMEMDIIDITTCTFLWMACNDKQFEYMSGTDFMCFLNLKELEHPVKVRSKEKLRVCYIISKLEMSIQPFQRARGWAIEVLKTCNISYAYYEKHRSDYVGIGQTLENIDFIKTIDKAFDDAKRLKSPI